MKAVEQLVGDLIGPSFPRLVWTSIHRYGRGIDSLRPLDFPRYGDASGGAERLRPSLCVETEARMSDCIHCDIHDLLEPELAREGADLGQIAAKVTEVLADLVLIAAAEDRAALLADVIANLGHMVLEKGEQPEAGDEPKPRRH
jgi:hypothetical protein